MSDVRRLPVGEETEGSVTLDDLVREGARRMIAAALEAEVEECVGSLWRRSMRTASGWLFAMVARGSAA
jgi:hypothetical protein